MNHLEYSLQPGLGSYLGYPRIHFHGQFRADSDTRNNERCNYRMDHKLNSDTNGVDWGFNGTNEFQFFNTSVTSVVYENGSISDDDPIIGQYIFSNLEHPYAKLTDLDTDEQGHSTIYGMEHFGIKWSRDFPKEDDIAFTGKWTRNVIAQNMWSRIKCYSEKNHGHELYQDSFPFSSQSTTTITNIMWPKKDNKKSKGLAQLKHHSETRSGGNLAVRITLQYYTRNYPSYVPYNATLGYVYGVIGIPGERDTLNVPGDRVMFPTKYLPTGLTNFKNGDLCSGQNVTEYHPWVNTAPFEVATNEVRFDLSNSIPVDLNNSLRNIGNLQLGVRIADQNCILLLGDEYIDYDSDKDFPQTSGIYTVRVDENQVNNSPLLLVQVNDGGEGQTICSESVFPSLIRGESHTAIVLLEEAPYFARPKGYYVDRLDRNEHPSSTMTFYVSKFGVPAPGVGIEMHLQKIDINGTGGFLPMPEDGVVLDSSSSKVTDPNGYAEFTFKLGGVAIPPNRTYHVSPCVNQTDPSDDKVLPIDGQVYNFGFSCITETDGKSQNCNLSDITLSFLAFSDIDSISKPNWVDHVGPILSQFARLSPIMNTILDMSDYHDVIKPHNLDLLKEALSFDIEKPSHMPTTRDLSPAKREMIKKWLDKPLYNSSSGWLQSPEVSGVLPVEHEPDVPYKRCYEDMSFTDDPEKLDSYFESIRKLPGGFISQEDLSRKRPLMGHVRGNDHLMLCSKKNIMTQLQTALELEWATIPPYLTALYSIVDGYNKQIYKHIRAVVMQEMGHFLQVANILIALDATPIINSADSAPKYPSHLPGKVLPKLCVKVKKFSRAHVHDVFMGIELPQKTEVAGDIDNENYTIGAFYQEIQDCINDGLSDEDFNNSSLERQVVWPFAVRNDVVKVNSKDSAIEAIEFIVSQGEGSNPLDPYAIESGQLAHFFQFEEIVCGKHLKNIDNDSYSYSGCPIPFNPEGVWPMRDGPKSCNIPRHTNCYTESKAFHEEYRALLRKLDRVFDAHPDEIIETVTSMESLQAHAKKLMWTKFNPKDDGDPITCGPVWDYDWKDSCPHVEDPEDSCQ